jgi:hypothetical protein
VGGTRAGSHLAAGLGTFPARFRAFPAMLHVIVFRAFFSARGANLRAELADALREFRAARHLVGRERAHVGTAPIKLDAAGEHFHIVLLQACARAVFTLGDALLTRINAVLVFFV